MKNQQGSKVTDETLRIRRNDEEGHLIDPDETPLAFDCSVVIPTYNAEEWIEEAIESVVRQSIGPDRVQAVVVNDGSSDATGQIVDDFARRHPEQIKVVHKENGGVASALNMGVQAADGKYVGFMGSDDYLDDDAVEKVIEFFDEHEDEVDLVAIPIYMFGHKKGSHWANRNKYQSTRVIDVTKNWNVPHLHGGGTFIKAETLKSSDLKFDERLFITEDATMNSLVILKKLRYGVVVDVKYNNRQHKVGTSLVSTASRRREFYTGVPYWAYMTMIQESIRQHGSVLKYIQAVVAYDIVWRFRDPFFGNLPDDLKPEYKRTLRELLRYIDLDVIMKTRSNIAEKLHLINFKDAELLSARSRFSNGTLEIDGDVIYSFRKKKRIPHRPPNCHIRSFKWNGSTLRLSGEFGVPEMIDADYGFVVDGQVHRVQLDSRWPSVKKLLDEDVVLSRRFTVEIPLGHQSSFKPVAIVNEDGEERSYPLGLRLHRYSGFSGSPVLYYFRREGRSVFRQTGRSEVVYEELGLLGVLRREAGFVRRARRAGATNRALALRALASTRRSGQKKKIVLLGDHVLEAGDNAEALFRYGAEVGEEYGYEFVFWLDKSSPAYESLSKLGKVVAPRSLAHKLAYLSATWSLTSAGDEYVLNPLGRDITYLNDLRPQFQGFLQHGITKDDQSAWLNKWQKGFDLFVTSSPREQKSIQGPEYGYEPEDVILSGMPRYDRLEDRPEGKVLIAPTWRRSLVGSLDPSTGRNAPTEAFSQSEYFSFWQKLIADDRLNAALSSRGMRGVFALHPSHAAEVPKFVPGAAFEVSDYPHDYRELFASSDILVTDYSSVAFDFGYLRKPVLYAQPDREQFFSGHLYSAGYFSYFDDGFGPVAESYDETLDKLIGMVEAQGVLDPIYRERIDSFFAFDDKQNSARVFQAMRRLSGE